MAARTRSRVPRFTWGAVVQHAGNGLVRDAGELRHVGHHRGALAAPLGLRERAIGPLMLSSRHRLDFPDVSAHSSSRF